jgi:Zn-dependent protease with chaperone function
VGWTKVRYLYLFPSILLILAAPLIFSYANALAAGHYVKRSEGGPWEYEQNPWGIVIGVAAAFGVWTVALPLLIIGLRARPTALKRGLFLSIVLLFCGLVMLGWSLPLSLWFKETFGLVIDQSYLMIESIIWIAAAGISLILDVAMYYKAFFQFLSNLTVVKRANISLERTEFRVLGYEEKSKHLVREAKTFKLIFQLLSLSAIILCLYYTYQNIIYFVGILLSIDLSLRGLLAGTIALIQNVFTLYLISIIPLTIVLVFMSGLILRTRASDVGLTEAKQDEFVELIRSEAKDKGLPAPKVAYSSDVTTLETIKCEKSSWILANPEVVSLLLENHPSELRAAIMHEFSHIINGDVDDKTRIYNVRSSLKLGTSKLMIVLGPLAVTFPLSLVLVAEPPVPSIVASYFTMISIALFLIGVGLSAEILKSGIRPIHIVPFLVSLFVGIMFLPFAIFWGKLNNMIEKRADLEATEYLQSKEEMISMLKIIQVAVRADPRIVVDQKLKKIGIMLRTENWRNYIVSIPLAILDGIYDYCQRYYLNIGSRIENLTTSEEVRPTRGTLVRRAILSIIGFFTDIPKNEGSQIGLAIGLLFSPVIFIIHYFPNNGNIIISTILTITTIIIIAKIGKYVREFGKLIAWNPPKLRSH